MLAGIPAQAAALTFSTLIGRLQGNFNSIINHLDSVIESQVQFGEI